VACVYAVSSLPAFANPQANTSKHLFYNYRDALPAQHQTGALAGPAGMAQLPNSSVVVPEGGAVVCTAH